MHKYILILSLIVLASCTRGQVPSPTPDTKTPPNPVTSTAAVTEPQMMKNPSVSLNYTLREWAPDGKILETTKEDVARANNLYKTGATYVPFEVTLGTNSVIPGFERGIASMKKGEKKMIEVLPADGYGESNMKRTVKESEVAPEFTITTDKSQFEDTSVQTVQRNLLGEQGKSLTEWQTLTGGANVVAKVTKIEGDNITLTIDNKENPFYGKKLEVGATAKKGKISFTIKALTDKAVTVLINNGESPFSGKPFVVGASASIPGSNGQPSPGNIKILAISRETVEIDVPNNHPLAGKKLYFEVELLNIK